MAVQQVLEEFVKKYDLISDFDEAAIREFIESLDVDPDAPICSWDHVNERWVF